MTTTKSYDKVNRLLSISSTAPGLVLPESYRYDYNAASQRTCTKLADRLLLGLSIRRVRSIDFRQKVLDRSLQHGNLKWPIMNILQPDQEFKKLVWAELDKSVKPWLAEKLKREDGNTSTEGITEIQEVIVKALASSGINDPEDLWVMLLTSIADEYWCETFNGATDE